VPPTTIGVAPSGKQPVDLRVREAGVLADREAGVDRQERDEAVLQQALLAGRGDAGEDLEAAVDLQCVGRDGDRPLAPRAQPCRHGERDVGLADPGGAEEREQHGASMAGGTARYGDRMAVRIGSGLATGGDARASAVDAAMDARLGLDGESADLAVVFVAGDNVAAAETVLEGVHEALAPGALVGCGAGGVLGGRREVETGTAVAVWASFDEAGRAFHAEATRRPRGSRPRLPDLGGGGACSAPTRVVPHRRACCRLAPGAPACRSGGTRQRRPRGGGVLFLATASGTARRGRALDGIELLPSSPGGLPLGPELTVTAAEGKSSRSSRPAAWQAAQVILDLEPPSASCLSAGCCSGWSSTAASPSTCTATSSSAA
jgi:hypothetical protein